MSELFGIKTEATIQKHVCKLMDYDWLGYNEKTQLYFIRGFKRIAIIENHATQKSAVFNEAYFANFRAWCGAVMYANLYRKEKWRRKKEVASNMVEASQPSKNAPLFLPCSTLGFAKYYGLSLSKSSELKKLAFNAGFIDVNKNYSPVAIPAQEKKLYQKHGDPKIANRLRIRKGEVFLQQIDTILPHIALSKRKK